MTGYAEQGFSYGSFGTLDLGTGPATPKDGLDKALDDIFFEKEAAKIGKLLGDEDSFDFETYFAQKEANELTQDEIEAFGTDSLIYFDLMMQKIEEEFPLNGFSSDAAGLGDPLAPTVQEPAFTFELGYTF